MFQCTICLEDYNSGQGRRAKLLSCGHTFCQICLKDVQKTDQTGRKCGFKCPNCRKAINIGPKGVDGIPCDFRLTKLQEYTKEIHNMKTMILQNKRCDVCEEEKAVSYCEDCVTVLCVTCTQKHQTTLLFQGHRVVAILPSKEQDQCPAHGRVFHFVCMTCKRLLCPICLLQTCSVHDVRKIDEAKKSILQDILSVKEQLMNKIEASQAIFNFIGDGSDWEKNIKDMRKTLSVHMRGLHSILAQNENLLMNSIDNYERKMRLIVEEIHEHKGTFESIKHFHSRYLSAVEKDETLEMVDAFDSIPAGHKLLNTHLPASRDYSFVMPNLTLLNDMTVGRMYFSDQVFELVAEDSNIKQLIHPVWDMAFMPDQTLFMTHGYNQGFSVKDRTTGNITYVLSPVRLYGIAWHPPTKALLAIAPFQKCIVHFYKLPELANFNTRSTLLPNMHSPTDIAVLANGNIVITDTGCRAQSVSIHTLEGICVNKWRPQNNSAEPSMPSKVIVDNQDRIIVAENRMVNIYDIYGSLLNTIKRGHNVYTVMPDKSFWYPVNLLPPRAMYLSLSHQNIFVVFKNLEMYSYDGEYIKTLYECHGDNIDSIAVYGNNIVLTTGRILKVLPCGS